MHNSSSVLNPTSAAIISDSAVEWLTQDRFFEVAAIGKYEVADQIAMNTPDTLLELVLSAAKSASV